MEKWEIYPLDSLTQNYVPEFMFYGKINKCSFDSEYSVYLES